MSLYHMRQYQKPATGNVQRVGLNYLSDLVVRPGIEKWFRPLLLYRGNMNPGRAHRLWNMTLLMMAAEAETLADGLRLVNNPSFSQLCGPVRAPTKPALWNFFGRLHDAPDATRQIEGLTEYVKSLELGPCRLKPVDIESEEANCAPWRVSIHPEPGREPTERGAKPLFYPYVVHDGSKSDGHELVMLAHQAVPEYLPDHIRADACQDLIVAVLSGEIDKEQMQDHINRYVGRVWRMQDNRKYGHRNLDAPLGHDTDQTLHDVIHDGSYQHWSDQMVEEGNA